LEAGWAVQASMQEMGNGQANGWVEKGRNNK